MRNHFYGGEAESLEIIRKLMVFVTEQDFQDEPCLRLVSQLNSCEVFCTRLLTEIHKMQSYVTDALKETNA